MIFQKGNNLKSNLEKELDNFRGLTDEAFSVAAEVDTEIMKVRKSRRADFGICECHEENFCPRGPPGRPGAPGLNGEHGRKELKENEGFQELYLKYRRYNSTDAELVKLVKKVFQVKEACVDDQ
ncbi:Collagen alpha-2(IV) chain [Trichinella spiralis]|uniref:Collagen alpha-2(IV) chain n=1 Tax=Trichinella spiralis TaxID=6334 RepID=A0ABR3L352_TRISP